MLDNITHRVLNDLGASCIARFNSLLDELDITSVKFKSINDAVTVMDLELQRAIFGFIEKIDPGSSVISEEKLPTTRVPDCCWIVDPLDGTSNFIQGVNLYGCSIAKVDGAKVLAAVVCDFTTKKTYTALSSRGAYINGQPLVKRRSKIRLLGASTGFLKTTYGIPGGCNIRVLGCQSLQLCMVAEGILDATTNYEAKSWDDAAGSLVVQEAGGVYVNAYRDIPWASLAADDMQLSSLAISESHGELYDHYLRALKTVEE